MWVEKELIRSPKEKKYEYTHYYRFVKTLKKFHRLDDSFLSNDSLIEYKGTYAEITLSGGVNTNAKITIKGKKDSAYMPKISFVPAERNLISAVENIDRSYRARPSENMLANFILEHNEAQKEYTRDKPLTLTVDHRISVFHNDNQLFILQEGLKKPLPTYYASSGIQSSFPIDVIATYLYQSIGKTPKHNIRELLEHLDALEHLEKGIINKIASSSNPSLRYSSMSLFLEEPEQNLYPDAQRKLILSLIDLICISNIEGIHPSYFVMTTHSPYILSVLNTRIALVRTHKQILSIENISEREKKLQTLKASFLNNSIDFETYVTYLGLDKYAAYYVTSDGTLKNLIDEEYPMISGVELDSVSEWTEEQTHQLLNILYGEE